MAIMLLIYIVQNTQVNFRQEKDKSFLTEIKKIKKQGS